MKRLVLLALVLAGSVQAQQQPLAPENIAGMMYFGCLRAQAEADRTEIKTKAELKQYLTDTDDYCLTWTFVWFGPMTGNGMDKWNTGTVERFEAHRKAGMDEFERAWMDANGDQLVARKKR